MPSPLMLCLNHSSCPSTRTNHDKVQHKASRNCYGHSVLYIVGTPYHQACLIFISVNYLLYGKCF